MAYNANNIDIINAGLQALGNLTANIVKYEQVTPDSSITSKYYVKSVMLYAALEQIIAIDQGIINVGKDYMIQLKLHLQQIIKTNIP